ncbi:MAG: hypothetical protein JWL76_361 [Thermoleophilia bacterium]|nr:hypothetical protein [Thermoleophilia bacterium]
MQIRSFARAFPTDRRIYRIDRWAIPIPGGLPLAASAWFLALAIAVWALGQLPGVGRLVDVVGWPAAVIVAPGAGALALTRRCDDGRTLPQLAMHRGGFELRAICARDAKPTAIPRTIRVAADVSLPGRVLVHGPGRITLPTWTHPQLARRGLVVLRPVATDARATATVLQLAIGEMIEARA